MIVIIDNNNIYKIIHVGYIREIGDIHKITNGNNETIGLFIEYNKELKERLKKNGKIVVLIDVYKEDLRKIGEILRKVLYNNGGGDKE